LRAGGLLRLSLAAARAFCDIEGGIRERMCRIARALYRGRLCLYRGRRYYLPGDVQENVILVMFRRMLLEGAT
jgi:hypothetical protein